MKNKTVILLLIGTGIALIVGIVLFKINKNQEENKLEIIDATYVCDNVLEKFYEDSKYTYYFPCTKSNSIYLKYPNGNKILVVNALDEEKITIDELLDLGIEVEKKKK